MKYRLIYLISSMLLLNINAYSQESAETRAEVILNKMTLKEKIDFIGGTKGMCIRGYDHLKIPEMTMCDGPLGVRQQADYRLSCCTDVVSNVEY